MGNHFKEFSSGYSNTLDPTAWSSALIIYLAIKLDALAKAEWCISALLCNTGICTLECYDWF